LLIEEKYAKLELSTIMFLHIDNFRYFQKLIDKYRY
jgi:hypothetical protein